MSLFFKKFGLVLLTLLLLSGCAKKLPPQINEGKAFSEQPYVVQESIRYSIEDYRFGLMLGDKPAKANFLSIKILAENIGNKSEPILPGKILFLNNKTAFKVMQTDPIKFINKDLAPGKTLKGWLIFKISEQPKGQSILNIKDGQITIR